MFNIGNFLKKAVVVAAVVAVNVVNHLVQKATGGQGQIAQGFQAITKLVNSPFEKKDGGDNGNPGNSENINEHAGSPYPGSPTPLPSGSSQSALALQIDYFDYTVPFQADRIYDRRDLSPWNNNYLWMDAGTFTTEAQARFQSAVYGLLDDNGRWRPNELTMVEQARVLLHEWGVSPDRLIMHPALVKNTPDAYAWNQAVEQVAQEWGASQSDWHAHQIRSDIEQTLGRPLTYPDDPWEIHMFGITYGIGALAGVATVLNPFPIRPVVTLTHPNYSYESSIPGPYFRDPGNPGVNLTFGPNPSIGQTGTGALVVDGTSSIVPVNPNLPILPPGPTTFIGPLPEAAPHSIVSPSGLPVGPNTIFGNAIVEDSALPEAIPQGVPYADNSHLFVDPPPGWQWGIEWVHGPDGQVRTRVTLMPISQLGGGSGNPPSGPVGNLPGGSSGGSNHQNINPIEFQNRGARIRLLEQDARRRARNAVSPEQAAREWSPQVTVVVKQDGTDGPETDGPEFDIVLTNDGVIIEDKDPYNLSQYPIVEDTNAPTKWAERQIYNNTVKKITTLLGPDAVRTRSQAGEQSFPELVEIRNIDSYHFRIRTTDPLVKEAVDAQLLRLQNQYPTWTFSVEYTLR